MRRALYYSKTAVKMVQLSFPHKTLRRNSHINEEKRTEWR